MTVTTPDTTSGPLAAPVTGRESRWRRVVRMGRRDKLAVAALVTVILIVVVALAAPLIAPHDPSQQEITNRLQPPVWADGGAWAHPFGTDQLGRDILSRVIWGARMSLLIGVASVALAMAIGVTAGLIAGYVGGWVERVIMQLCDINASFPGILIAIIVLMVLSPKIWLMILVLGGNTWLIHARMVRGEVKALRETEFVEAARAIGARPRRIMRRHLLPNITSSLVTLGVLEIAHLIIAESILSFLGLGVQPPLSSWGLMIGESRNYVSTAWWLIAFPGLAIMVTVLSMNLVANWLRTVSDPVVRYSRGEA